MPKNTDQMSYAEEKWISMVINFSFVAAHAKKSYSHWDLCLPYTHFHGKQWCHGCDLLRSLFKWSNKNRHMWCKQFLDVAWFFFFLVMKKWLEAAINVASLLGGPLFRCTLHGLGVAIFIYIHKLTHYRPYLDKS